MDAIGDRPGTLEGRLAQLPEHDRPGFTLGAVGALRQEMREHPREAIAELERLRASGEEPLAFTAWYLLIWYHRRFRDLERVDELVRAHFDAYRERPVAMLMRAEMLSRHPFEDGGYEEGLRLCEDAGQQVGSHLALTHQLKGQLLLRTARELEPGRPREAMLARARASLERSIEMRERGDGRLSRDGRARHRLAEVLLELGAFDVAAETVEKAIDLEDSTTPDYAVRIGEYQATRTQIESRRLLDRLENEVRSHVGAVAEMRTQFIEIVGLIGLVIAFLASGANLVATSRIERPVAMFMGIAGSLTVVFSAFRLLFNPGDRTVAEQIGLTFGALLIGVGLLVAAMLVPG